MQKRTQLISQRAFKLLIWTLCGLSSALLASRFVVRCSRKERLKRSDSLLLLALPSLFAGSALLYSVLGQLYGDADFRADQNLDRQYAGVAPRLTAAIELLWITIYCVKASFLLQFKFHKPPYSLVSASLTRYYWATISICAASFLCTLAVPLVLCPSSSKCRILKGKLSDTRGWEVPLTIFDVVTDLMVISIPCLLIRMANLTLSRAIINTAFKSLSVFAVTVAAIRLAFLCKADSDQVNYLMLILWLVVEAAVSLAAVSISSYRIVLLDILSDRQVQRDDAAQQGGWQLLSLWRTRSQVIVAKITTPGPSPSSLNRSADPHARPSAPSGVS